MIQDMRTVFDPLRRKEVALTPEEEVRQWCIKVMSENLGVPLHMMMSEASLKLGAKQYRAGILVYDRTLSPVMVVECKRPDVELTPEVLDQALRYNMVLNVRYVAITNGSRTFVCAVDEGKCRFMDTLPKYNEMIK